MPFVFTMPKLSPTMEDGTIVKWRKKEGEFAQAGEVIVEIATDKATVEHAALDEGWLRKILVPEGGAAIINQPVAIFSEQENESIEALVEKIASQAASKKTPEAPQEKEAASITSPPKASTPSISQPAFVPEPPLAWKPSFPPSQEKLKATPLAKTIAKEKGLDLSTASGTGPGGRITSRDLSSAQSQGLVAFGKQEVPSIAPGSYEEIPLSPMRKIIARRLQESKSFIPHFYIKQVIDAEALIALREELKAFNLHATYNDMILRAVALSLRLHPEINRGFNSVNQTLIQFKTIDISVAVTVDGGLITPIIRHADFKNLGQISSEMRTLISKARSHKLQEHEYKGGSFCVSNLGMFGISEFTAVINPPQAAILAIGGIEERPVVKNGQVIAGKTLTLTLSVDHRVIDGASGAEFIKTLEKILKNPSVLLV